MLSNKVLKWVSCLKNDVNESKKFISEELITKKFFIKFFYIYLLKKLIEIVEIIIKNIFWKT
ncbi:MAG: hypothetical protein AD073_000261 [Mycoplasmataceae bacterium]|nr:MAG: hypothetical protein AD073_000261 [Mycoplasmataceae bacterium]